jgi:hypothetical protein
MSDELIEYTSPISKDEAEESLEIICSELRAARSVAHLFREIADPDSYRRIHGSGLSMMARIKNENIRHSLVFEYDVSRAVLTFYNCPPEKIPSSGVINVFVDDYAEIVSGEKNMGEWAAGLGNRKGYGISFRLKTTMHMPSPVSEWFFNIMKWFAMISNEYHLRLSEQEGFWDGAEGPD